MSAQKTLFLLVAVLIVPFAVSDSHSYDDQLLSVDDLVFVISQFDVVDIDVRADYDGDSEATIFDLVLVASHMGDLRSEARQWSLDVSGLLLELGVVEQGVEVFVTCPDGSSWCRVRRTDDWGVVVEGSGGVLSAVDSDVVSGQEYTYRADYYVADVLQSDVAERSIVFTSTNSSGSLPAPTVTLTASPSTISSGSSSTLSWSSTDADSCTASGAWSGSRDLSGSLSVSLTSTSTYTLSCTGTGGTASASTSVSVSSSDSEQNSSDDSGSGEDTFSGSIPTPQTGDTILLDTRQSLQQATTHAEAAGLFSNVHPNLRTTNPDAWGFTTDFDGKGTRALVAKWVGVGTNWGDQSRMIQQYFPSDVRPQDLYIQFKQWMGRTPHDTDVAHGVLERFDFTNPEDPGSPNAARKMLRTLGPRWDSDIQRVTATYPGPEPLRFRAYGDYNIASSRADGAHDFVTQDLQNRELVYTFHIRAESSQGAQDGAMEWWIHDGATGEIVDAGSKENAEFGFYGTSVVTFPTVMRSPKEDMSEYFWDVLLWTTD